jgi:putative ABC transport system ATP-binding protein
MTAGDPRTTSVGYFEDVHKTYRMGSGDVHALAGVTVAFAPGSFWAIMGASGSGKSTMLNLLGCLDRPSGGRYFLAGQEVNSLSDQQLSEFRLRRVGFIFQSFNLIAQLTVAENVELPLYYLGWPKRQRTARVLELAAMVGLSERLRHRPAELSGGQQQRVAVARALAADPAIILADEPTGNLDTRTGLQIMSLLAELNQAGRTIIMVTHEQDIAAYADRRLHLRDGKVASEE